MSLSVVAKERMNRKLLDTIKLLSEEKERKREVTALFNENIKASQKRIDALAEAIESDDILPLQGVLYKEEIEALLDQSHGKASIDHLIYNGPMETIKKLENH